ncbi:hypothetical protein GGTG_11020 [Gaeumannomyces tritici R3-111a-1]|uniref:Uncharacterized protein n=1 Tax=Gaeumannomyces tritici (strain R3-111a-1) TaxID=644352 RepID=J3PBZ6_GAET3|nr:hypothetical protein GGTG_11020 [Gaeumannomyces tritici R3-111a-1]EJT71766.1 hypothetical protein GGTG_11020 [Gaeumannomyces tritici R3-111a-1]
MKFTASSLLSATLAFVACGQVSAICYWDTCCYTNHNGPGACPPQLWAVTLTGSYCKVSICPATCVNTSDSTNCDCCDIRTGTCREC